MNTSIYYQWDIRNGGSGFTTINEVTFFGKRVFIESAGEFSYTNSFDELCKRADFLCEDNYSQLEIFSNGDKFIFCFESAGSWVGIRVDGMLNYIAFIKKYVTPFMMFRKLCTEKGNMEILRNKRDII